MEFIGSKADRVGLMVPGMAKISRPEGNSVSRQSELSLALHSCILERHLKAIDSGYFSSKLHIRRLRYCWHSASLVGLVK